MGKGKRKPGQWWDKSWSVVTGCSWPEGEQPEGCRNCWARGFVRRLPAAHGWDVLPYVPGGDCVGEVNAIPFGQVVCHPERLDQPLRRRKPTVYAVSLLGDLFHQEVSRMFVDAAWDVMERSTSHRFAALTKRYPNARDTVNWMYRGGDPENGEGDNIILLASVWDQDSTDAACAAFQGLPIRWGLHMEPLLGPVDMRKTVTNRIGASMPSWIVVGPENGPGKRPCDPKWIESIERQCRVAGVPVWRKADDGPKETPW